MEDAPKNVDIAGGDLLSPPAHSDTRQWVFGFRWSQIGHRNSRGDDDTASMQRG